MANKPSIPKGTRDFSPAEMSKRNYIFDTIKDVFRLFGFEQIETPAMEMLSTLMGKYGDEGDKLLFKIQNSGDYFSALTDDELLSRDCVHLASKFCEKGLRYDLTVPFARYVVMHRGEIAFPFKRYQIQPVWRADRPQKGRYREFYQCDADIVGSESLLNEVELIMMIDEVFRRLGIRVAIKVNNRKILAGIAEIDIFRRQLLFSLRKKPKSADHSLIIDDGTIRMIISQIPGQYRHAQFHNPILLPAPLCCLCHLRTKLPFILCLRLSFQNIDETYNKGYS